ncbi:MAG TPA: FtsX-like permease family protein [Gemmatimonadales bacterium]|nr:FtsX-like permease family protein [Gemmatimonadales bacterium]
MTGLRFVLAMAWREGKASGRRLLLLTAAISIGVGALVAINSFTDNLRTAVEGQSRALLGGDMVIHARSRPDSVFTGLVDSIAGAAGISADADRAAVTSFEGMAYVPRTSGARLVRVSAVDGGYPFYGQIRTDPAGTWSDLTKQDRVTLVDPSFLTALGAQVGDTMALGNSRFRIVGTVTGFPGDVGIRAAFGPRVFIPGADLAATGLITFGSRVEYEWYLRTSRALDARAFAERWRPVLARHSGGIRTAAEEERDLKQFLDQLRRYLGLVALVALLLGGIGVASAVQVFIRRKRDTIAVLRCLGATGGQVFLLYLVQALAMGLAGSLIGACMGVMLQFALPHVFGQFLPLDLEVRPSPAAILLGIGVGAWVAAVFAVLPLLQVRTVPPLAVLRHDVEEATPAGGRDLWRWAARGALAASIIALAVLQVANPLRGLLFALGAGAALLVLWLAALGLIRGLRRWFPSRLLYVYRQGLANLYRPANQTVAVVLALGFGAFLLGALAVAQHNVLQQLQLDRGEGRPNLVFFDIQPDQKDDVLKLIHGEGLTVEPTVPIVPMRLQAINGVPVSTMLPDSTPRRRGGGERRVEPWALRREYRSTYRDTTVGSERLVSGRWWEGHPAPGAPVPVSLETGIASDLNVKLGDTLTWDIQGVPLTSVIANLREVNWARFEPNFFAVFPTGPLDEAPQSFVLLTRSRTPAETGRLQRLVAERDPNVTSIDLSSVQQTIERIVGSVALAIRFMALFSLATGAVVLIGALAASRLQRLREAALLKTLGATRRQIIGVMVTEYAALGALAAIVATGLATLGGWALTRWVFEVPFSVPWSGFGWLALLLLALPIVTGLWTSAALFRQSALEVLRSD